MAALIMTAERQTGKPLPEADKLKIENFCQGMQAVLNKVQELGLIFKQIKEGEPDNKQDILLSRAAQIISELIHDYHVRQEHEKAIQNFKQNLN